jgi:hypothetical protein
MAKGRNRSRDRCPCAKANRWRTTYEFPWDDAAAKTRLKRVLALYPLLLVSERFAPFRRDYYYQEFKRGLATWEVEGFDLTPEGRVGYPSAESRATIPCPPLRRWVAQYRREGLAGLARKERSDRGKRRLSDTLRQAIEGLALKKPLR